MTTANQEVAIVDCGSSKVPYLAQVLEDLGAVPHVIRPDQLPAMVSKLPTAIIISGNPALICETGTNFLADFEVLRTLSMPVLGICFGIVKPLFGFLNLVARKQA